jgi:molybdopterin adenylyltransferase
VITVSTAVAAGFGRDESGPLLRDLARELGAEEVEGEVVPDDRDRLQASLRYWIDREGCRLVLTTGGTGFSPTDHTPEATRAVIEREAPGIPEAMRMVSRRHTEHWMLSRAAAGIRGQSLIVNFPGSPNSIRETADFLAPGLRHALDLLAGRQPHPHGPALGRG